MPGERKKDEEKRGRGPQQRDRCRLVRHSRRHAIPTSTTSAMPREGAPTTARDTPGYLYRSFPFLLHRPDVRFAFIADACLYLPTCLPAYLKH